jgi:acetyl esterase/lipase
MRVKFALMAFIVFSCLSVTLTISACRPEPAVLTKSPGPTAATSSTITSTQTITITSGSTGKAQTGSAPYAELEGTIKRNITYYTVDSVILQLDIYFPKVMSGKAPAVLYVHGGAWTIGDKNIGAGSEDVVALTAAGFIVVPVNYRLAPAFKFPAMIEDAKCAVRFLRANANQYGINADKIGAYGGSAGGHLVSLLGLTDRTAGWDTGPYIDYSSQIQAVVDMFGLSVVPALFGLGQQQIAFERFRDERPEKPGPDKSKLGVLDQPGRPAVPNPSGRQGYNSTFKPVSRAL